MTTQANDSSEPTSEISCSENPTTIGIIGPTPTNDLLHLMQKSMAGTERISSDRNLIIKFLPDSLKNKTNLDIMFNTLRLMELGSYWQTMQCDPDVIRGYTFGFIVPASWARTAYIVQGISKITLR
jgi:hypothetical protein